MHAVDLLSGTLCARALNDEFPDLPRLTRNAVIGKIHRLQLPRPTQRPVRVKVVRPPKERQLVEDRAVINKQGV